MNESKSVFASKTMWLNVLTLLVAVLATITSNEWVASHPEVLQVLLYANAGLNVLLRFLTGVPVTIFGGGSTPDRSSGYRRS